MTSAAIAEDLKAPPLAWARVLGRGALRRDFGHGIAVNAVGRVLVAARFDTAGGAAAGDTGTLMQLDTDGATRWRLPLAHEAHQHAPRIALDDDGAAYVLGPYQPRGRDGFVPDAFLRLTKLDAGGQPRWSTPCSGLGPLLPQMSLAADGRGGAGAAWLDGNTLRIASFGPPGVMRPIARFPFLGSVDPRVGIAFDAGGAALVWGSFSGAIRFEQDKPPLMSRGCDRFVVRVLPDGRAQWSCALRASRADDYAVAGHSDGGVTLAAVLPPRAGDRRDPAARDLLLAQLDARGSTLRRTRFAGSPHAWASIAVARTGADASALAGYFSGSFTIAGTDVSSATAAAESIFVARVGDAGQAWARALHGPELQAGLSVHGDASGAVLLAGWCAGAMDLGGARIPAGEGAAFFVARYGA